MSVSSLLVEELCVGFEIIWLEDSTLHNHLCENRTSDLIVVVLNAKILALLWSPDTVGVIVCNPTLSYRRAGVAQSV
jgi:hypothetical protein